MSPAEKNANRSGKKGLAFPKIISPKKDLFLGAITLDSCGISYFKMRDHKIIHIRSKDKSDIAHKIIDPLLDDIKKLKLPQPTVNEKDELADFIEYFILESVNNSIDALRKEDPKKELGLINIVIQTKKIGEEHFIFIEILDTGPGFSPEQLKIIGSRPFTTKIETDPATFGSTGQHLLSTNERVHDDFLGTLTIKNQSYNSGKVSGAFVGVCIPIEPPKKKWIVL